MKRILVFIIAILTFINFGSVGSAYADSCATGLMPVFTAAQAKKVCDTFSAGTIGVLANDTYAVGRNAANGANINAWKIDSGDNTVINSSASDVLILQLEDDASRLINFSAASDTALQMTFGDAGTTATQIFSLIPSTADADDDASIQLGFSSGTRGAGITLPGEEVSGGSDITYNAGTSDTHIFSIAGTAEATISNDALTVSGASFSVVPGATSFLFRNNANDNTNLGITDAGVVTARAGLVATAGGVTATAGDIVASASGATLRLQEATAGTKCMGTVTANGTTAVPVATTCALTASRIFISRTSLVAAGVTEPGCWATNIVDATSFDLDCNDAGEDSTFNWFIINESA